MVESCGCPRHSLDIRVIAVCYQKRRGRADTCRYQGDRWLLSEMISLRYRVNEALCGRNGRQRRVRCHGAASVPHPSGTPQRVASSPAVSCPVSRPSRIPWRRVRVVSRHRVGVASATPRACRIRVGIPRRRVHVASATPRPCRIRRAVAARGAPHPAVPHGPLRRGGSQPATAAIRNAAPPQRSEMPRRRTARAPGNIVTPVARRRGRRRRPRQRRALARRSERGDVMGAGDG